MSTLPDGSGERTSAFEEPRLQFFLRHREQIREWAALAEEVPPAVAEVLRGLAPDVAARLAGEPDIRVTDHMPGRSDVGLVLHHAKWTSGQPLEPFAGVALAWSERKVDP